MKTVSVLKKLFILLILITFSIPNTIYCQTPPASQTVGGLERREKDIEKEKDIERKIQEQKETDVIEEEVQETPTLDASEKVLIKNITVEGATLVPEKDIKNITSKFEGQELSLSEMKKITDAVTNLYRTKGYATSRAYLAPQTIKDSTLVIRVIEGKVGQITTRGNRYFKSKLLEKKIKLKPNGYFDYSTLQRSLVFINENPDRTAKAILAPGTTPGTTDIILQVEDRFPMHIGFEYDNHGSRFIGKNRFTGFLEHNNLLGFDDKMYLKYQRSESSWYELENARYLFPINETTELGAYFLRSDLELGREYKDVDAKGRATIGGIFLNKGVWVTDSVDLRINLGYDYKHVRNFVLGVETSRDEIRVAKAGFDLDVTDPLGRTVVTGEFDLGIPRMFGGLTAKDSKASRQGAGGQFNKTIFNIFRLQPLLFSSSLLLKNTLQISPYNLVASEQFQIGGPSSVRGYPPGEFSGDEGLYSSAELYVPPYGVPKEWKIPLTKEKIYDTLRLVVFYDWATTHVNTVLAGEEKHRTLRGWGFGARLNLVNNLLIRVECGYPIGQTPSDSNHFHPWVEISKKF